MLILSNAWSVPIPESAGRSGVAREVRRCDGEGRDGGRHADLPDLEGENLIFDFLQSEKIPHHSFKVIQDHDLSHLRLPAPLGPREGAAQSGRHAVLGPGHAAGHGGGAHRFQHLSAR